jgi:methionyl-tRNA synthetase
MLQIHEAIKLIFNELTDINKWLTESNLWNLKADSDTFVKNKVIRTLLEFLYVMAHVLEPIIPNTSQEIFRRLGTNQITLPEFNNWDNLRPGTLVVTGPGLFPRIGANRIEKKKANK